MIREIAEKLNFPEEAILVFEDGYKKLLASEEAMKIASSLADWVFMGESRDFFSNFLFAKGYMEKLAEATGVHIYTINMVFWLACAKPLQYIYKLKNLSWELYIESMMDLKYKLDECKKEFDIWGSSTYWFKEFYSLERFSFGRLEYDVTTWKEAPYGDFLKEGDLVFNCHIPSSGPLLPDLVMDSIKRLYDHFKDKLKDGILVIRCNTWLLYPAITKFSGENSNLRRFAEFFDIVGVTESEERPYGDFSRLFGMNYEGPHTLREVPEDTSLRKAMKKHLLDGGRLGWGRGVILFDGEKIINK